MRFNPYILNGFDADYLINVDAEQLVVIIFHSQPQGADISGGAAHCDDIHRTVLKFHRTYLPDYLVLL